MPTVHLLIKGKVQGVFYRNTAKEIADKKGVQGWVRNTPEGDVEIIASGSEQALKDYIEWCYHGPKMAQVKAIMATEITEKKIFRIRDKKIIITTLK